MGLLVLLGIVCFVCFLIALLSLFADIGGESNLNFSWKQRFWIIVNLLVWAYECFFLVVVCGGVENLRVNFGTGMGDLIITLILGGTVLGHIVLLAVFASKRFEAVFFIALLCASIFPVALMHFSAAEGNEENGHMTGSYSTGLYYNIKTKSEGREHQQELEEAAKPKKPEFATPFESSLYNAEHGDLEAQNHVARCYALGEGVGQSDSLAIRWCRLAAEAGYALSQLNLGRCYYYGSHGLDVDYQEAVKWFLKAAEQGIDEAQYFTGRCYGNGEGVEQNDEEAFRWLRLAAQQGHQKAQELLRENKQTW